MDHHPTVSYNCIYVRIILLVVFILAIRDPKIQQRLKEGFVVWDTFFDAKKTMVLTESSRAHHIVNAQSSQSFRKWIGYGMF